MVFASFNRKQIEQVVCTVLRKPLWNGWGSVYHITLFTRSFPKEKKLYARKQLKHQLESKFPQKSILKAQYIPSPKLAFFSAT